MTLSLFPTLPELLRLRGQAHGLELGERRLALSVQAGGYRSVYHGRGLEFDEVRAYQAGDDVRSIDWRVTARRGKPHTKLFREERERPVLILADLDPAMLFGSRRTRAGLVLEAGALLAWSAARAGDRIGGLVSDGHEHREIPPMPRQDGVLALLKRMVELQPHTPSEPHSNGLDQALARLARVARPGSLLICLSDFRRLGEASERSLTRLTQHNDLVLGWISDPLEAEPPPAGRYRFGLPGRSWSADTGDVELERRWRGEFGDHQERLRRLAARLNASLMPLSTGEAVLPQLRLGLMRRGAAA